MTTPKVLVPLQNSTQYAAFTGTFFIIAWLIYYVLVKQEPKHTVNAWFYKEKNRVLPVQSISYAEHLDLNPRPFLPSAWWTDEKVFELERRAIFSKKWLFVTHTSRFQKPGDYRTFEVAGFSLLLVFGKDKQLRAFHNVCRHRAYAVAKKESGSSTILGCRYHGWSYDTKGQLMKAPEFETVPGFVKSLNGLWEVKLEIRQSMAFVNLNAGDDIGSVNTENQAVPRHWKAEQLICVADWKVEGALNWKMFEALFEESSAGEDQSYFSSLLPYWLTGSTEVISPSYTALFCRLPSGTVLSVRAMPKTSSLTGIECSIWRKGPQSSMRETTRIKQELSQKIKHLESKQRVLSRAPGGIGAGAFSISKRIEIQRLLEIHREAETKLGAQIHPTARNQTLTVEGQADDDFCRNLASAPESVCGKNSKGLLDW